MLHNFVHVIGQANKLVHLLANGTPYLERFPELVRHNIVQHGVDGCRYVI